MAKGENIYKRKDGRWEGRYKKGYDQRGKIRYGYCYGHSYREVKEKVLMIRLKTFSGFTESHSKGKTNFGTYCEQWMHMKQQSLKKSTIAKYQFMLEKHILPALGNYTVERITSEVLETFSYDLLYQKKLAPKTVRDILTVVHEILGFIRKDSGSALPAIVISYPKVERRELRVLSGKEQQQLTDYLLDHTDSYKFAVLLSLLTGLRIGEICGLRWEDISLETNVLTVIHTVQRIKNPDPVSSPRTILILGTPKTPTSKRTIPFTDGLAELFGMFYQGVPDTFILTGTGHFMEPRTLQRKLKKYTRELGMQDVHFHTLRHTFATRCVELGCDIKTLSELLGHANISITMNRYVHPSLELKRKNMGKLEQAGFLPSSPAPSQSSAKIENKGT